MPRLKPTGAGCLALVALVALLSCSDSEPDGVDHRSAPLAAIESVPIAGVLLAECASEGADDFDATPALGPLDPLGLVVLPPLESVVGSDLGDLLVTLELHEDELPILAALMLAGEDPSLWVPLPLEDALRALPATGLPLDVPVLGRTALECDAATDGELGLIPLFAAAPA